MLKEAFRNPLPIDGIGDPFVLKPDPSAWKGCYCLPIFV